MTVARVVLIHGAATTAAVWSRLLPLLDDLETLAVERPCSGDLDAELAFLAPLAEGAVVVGVGGGATLGLALASSSTTYAAALLHEPAAGSLAPDLLAPMAAAYADGGVTAFGATLYGPSWTRDMGPSDDAVVARELAMFRGFEPAAAHPGQGRSLVTTGGESAAARHAASAALHEQFGYETALLDGCRHFIHWDAPAVLAAEIRSLLAAII